MRAREVRREALVAAVGVALLAGLVIALDVGSPIRRVTADRMLRAAARLWPPAPPADLPDVAIVALDPRSLRAHADWPWPRRLHAEAVGRLEAAGARVIAFDLDFSSPGGDEDDAALARALAASGRGVLAGFRQVQEAPGGAVLEISNVPVPALANAAAAQGSVLVPVDPDGVVRFAPRASQVAGRELPSLAAAALEVATGRRPAGQGALAVDYRRAKPAIPVLPISDVLEGRFDRAQVAGRVVFVGATAAELQDLWSTPLGPARPGVWIQAMAYRTLAAEAGGARVLAYAAPFERMAWAAVVSCLAAALLGVSHRRRLAGLAALGVCVVAGSVAWLASRGLLVDPVVPGGVLALHYALGLETVRRRFGASLRERDVSLAALVRVGESTARSDGDGLSIALSLLGDVVDARSVALLRARPDGTLDGRRLEWRRRGEGTVGCTHTAAEVLAARRTRLFEGQLPGGGSGVAVYTPLFAGDAAVGVLVVEREPSEPLAATQLRTIATVGAQLALSAENLRLIDGLRRSFDSSIEAIASAVEARDGYTELHCRRLAIFASRMAERLGLPAGEVESVRLGALLHDVGKIGIRDSVLLKGGRFDARERAEMERHAPLGHQIIRRIHGMTDTTAACVRHHHEWWDGSGYPDGLAGEAIPLGARIVAVVDVWDALSTARPYKEAFPQERVRQLLAKGRGAQFDPALVDLFLQVLDEEGDEMLALVGSGPGRSAS